MKKIIGFFVLLLLIPLVSGISAFYDSEELVVDVDISSRIDLVHTESDYSVETVDALLSFYPRENFMQDILDFDIIGEAEEKNDVLHYSWDNPLIGEYDFGLSSKVKIRNDMKEIKRKVRFPLVDLDDKYLEFTASSSNIDSDDPEIISLASSLAAGEDDEYVVVYKIAEWVKNNIDYDLNTLTAEVSQKASWVLNSRYGVCDELTSLFVALVRSVGIPARFVSGMAYTSYGGLNGWGPHAWAEVYFLGYGWVPYDITYGQYGFVDPTHIVLKESFDSDESSVDYEWRSRNVNLETEKLDLDISLIESKGRKDEVIEIESGVLADEVGFGSYNLVEAVVRNPNDYYVATEVYIANVNEIDFVDNNKKPIMLKPNEEKKIFWIFKTAANLDRNYVYKVPLSVYTSRNYSSDAFGSVSFGGQDYSLDDVNTFVEGAVEEEEKVYSKNVDLICDSTKDSYYFNEDALVNCVLVNKGNTLLEDLDVCYKNVCREFDLGIAKKKEISFLLKEEAGKRIVSITAKNTDVSKIAKVNVELLDNSKVEIDSVIYPSNVDFDQKFNISFVLNKESYSVPRDLEITLKRGSFERKWNIDKLVKDESFVLDLNGRNLRNGVNIVEVIVDHDGGSVKEEFNIELQNVSLGQRFYLFFNGIGEWFKSLVN